MASGGFEAEQLRDGRSPVLPSLTAGLVTGSLSLVFTVSYAAILFTGRLEPFRDHALSIGIASAIIFGLVSVLAPASRGIWWTNQSAPLAITALGAAGLQSSMHDAPLPVLLSTTLVFVACSTAAAGLLMLAVGLARAGLLAKFVPYPVIGGFLTATGFFLLLRGAQLALPSDADPGLLSGLALWRSWLPYVALGMLLSLLTRRLSTVYVLLGATALYLVSFWIYVAASGATVEDVRAAGLLLSEGIDRSAMSGALWEARFAAPDLAALASQWQMILAVSALSFLGLLMNVTALELVSDDSRDLNKDLRTGGLANLAAALAGGFVGYPSVSMQQFNRKIAPLPSRLVATTGLAVLVLALVSGLSVLSYLPLGLFVIVISYIGAEIVYRWLIDGYREMPKLDYVIVLVILALTLLSGFAVAIVAGMIAATLRFAIAYSRVDVVRSGLSGRLRLSPVERSERDVEALLSRGAETLVFELQGFLFFGTANGLYDQVVIRIDNSAVPVRTLVIDFRRVEGMDISTAFVFTRLLRFSKRRGISVMYTHLKGTDIDRLDRSGALDGATVRPTLQDGLAQIEEEILLKASDSDDAEPSDLEVLFQRASSAGYPLASESERLGAGQVLFAQGDASDSLIYLEDGRLSALVKHPSGDSIRVAGFLPGSVVGEIGFIAATPRTATVMTETEVNIRRVSRTALARVTDEAPAIASDFHAHLARLLAKRLGRTTALFVAMDL